jgi:hypothetical protein
MGAPPPMPSAPHHKRVAWCVAFLGTVIRIEADHHPDWLVANHGRLIANPDFEFPRLFAALNLEWTAEAGTYLDKSNRPGTGYDRQRVRSELGDAWRRRLTTLQTLEIRAVLEQFPGVM